MGKAGAPELTVLFVYPCFAERGTNSWRSTAVNLTVHDHRIDDAAAILRDYISVDLHKTGGGIDLDGSQMGRACRGPVDGIVGVARLQFLTRLDRQCPHVRIDRLGDLP